MAIKIEMLRAFCAVAEAGNLTAAADRLGRTQSALSMTLKQLEAHLGRALFESDRKNRLTALGQQVFQQSQSQIRSFDTTVQSIELLARAPHGVLRVASVPSVAAFVFPELVGQITNAFPKVQVELRDCDTSQVLDSLTEGWADIGITSVHQVLNGVKSSGLFQDRFGLVVDRSHPLSKTEGPVSMDEVFGGAFISNDLCAQIDVDGFHERVRSVQLNVRDTQSLIALLQSGKWATVLPRTVTFLAPTSLVFREIKGLRVNRTVRLLSRDVTAFPEITEAACRVIKAAVPAGVTGSLSSARSEFTS